MTVDFEKLGTFYLGKTYDLEKKQASDELILYDAKDLTTHGVVVGMTGSGKTGLCLAILEEAAIDGIPAIVIDPKGDIPNILLTFPELRGEDFQPWINEEDAKRKGQSAGEYAEAQAALWKKGLADWGQDGARIQRLRDAADIVVYTPGSSAGLPVSILKSFAAPPQDILEDGELLRERVNTTVTSLLGLAGIDADPLQSREHILISTVLQHAWSNGQDLDLASLVAAIQNPPVSRIGVLDLETFYSSKDRFGLVMALNNLIAAPGFAAWLEGEALDIGTILYGAGGKPRVAIFSIAHLADAERMFFVSLLLNQVLGWMRQQSGTTSLRALLYMDEIFGYFPPTQNPPSKAPLLTLVKQARAFGLGVLLATQNPVDLDYKGLSNTGTWFIGRLQTERDKLRVLDGLEGAAMGGGFDRGKMDTLLSGLGNRVFLMNNTHEDGPVVFTTRWVMSYLRGPLTRNQIKQLMDPVRNAERGARSAEQDSDARGNGSRAAGGAGAGRAAAAVAAAPLPALRPSLPPEVQQFFIPAAGLAPRGASLVYEPMMLGAAKVNFADAKARIDFTKDVTCITPVTDSAVPVQWDGAEHAELDLNGLTDQPEEGASFVDLPPAAAKPKNYTGWGKDFVNWLANEQSLDLLYCRSLNLVAEPDEDERAFRIRIQQNSRESRDQAVEALRRKYASKLNTAEDAVRRAQQALEREESQSQQATMDTAMDIGASILGGLFGRKRVSASTLSRAGRSIGRARSNSGDVARARENLEVANQRLADLSADIEAETQRIADQYDGANAELETVSIKPKRTAIRVQLTALAWAPLWQDEKGNSSPAWR